MTGQDFTFISGVSKQGQEFIRDSSLLIDINKGKIYINLTFVDIDLINLTVVKNIKKFKVEDNYLKYLLNNVKEHKEDIFYYILIKFNNDEMTYIIE